MPNNGTNIVTVDYYICSQQDQSSIGKYFIGGRHKKLSVMYLSQSYFRLPYCKFYVVYDFPSKKERDLVSFDLQVSHENLAVATIEPYS